MTERLYFTDAYLTEFDATVVAHGSVGGRAALALDRSAFYPEGGGQPGDRGMIGGALVADVQAEGELVWHVLAGPEALADLPVGASVRGAIDWARRLDHMQQHCGQHILTAAFLCACGMPTVSFHLGEDTATIDLETPALSESQAHAAEELANGVVWEGRPVTARFVEPAELARLPLRKPPGAHAQVRVVAVQGFDYSACGGTHPHSSAGVGLISVQRWQRQRGLVRVEFVCGSRALRAMRRLGSLTAAAAGALSVGAEELPATAERLLAAQRAQAREIEQLRAELDAHEAERLYERAAPIGAARVARAVVPGAGPERLRALAQAVAAWPGGVALLGSSGQQAALVAACAADSGLDARALLQAGLAILGGRGGGTPRLAQGGGPASGDLDAALAAMADLASGE
jgi:alanyl-tRNA synthetase